MKRIVLVIATFVFVLTGCASVETNEKTASIPTGTTISIDNPQVSATQGECEADFTAPLDYESLTEPPSLTVSTLMYVDSVIASCGNYCSATSFLRNWDSILEKKRANLRSISEPARLRQPPPRSTGAAHARGRAQSIREERRIAAPPVLFALLWVRLLPALYGPFCGPLRPFGGCPWGVTPPARECLPPAPPDTRRRG